MTFDAAKYEAEVRAMDATELLNAHLNAFHYDGPVDTDALAEMMRRDRMYNRPVGEVAVWFAVVVTAGKLPMK